MKSAVLQLPILVALSTAIGVPFELPVQLPTVPVLRDATQIITANGSLVELPQIMHFPDDRGDPAPGKIVGNETAGPVEESDVFFVLYTRHGPRAGERIVPTDVASLHNSHFNASEPTFIITHGFLQGINGDSVQKIKDKYIQHTGGNVIAVDWSRISKNWLYFVVKIQLAQVGFYVASFVGFLAREGGVDVSQLHLIGHSMGAHVMGIAAKNILITVGKKPGRVTGLDPAGPLFSIADKTRRLDKGDAHFVDVIHTCGGWLGLFPPIGHADFYPNGGYMRQPGCSADIILAGTCSHSRAWEFFSESIHSHGFSSRPCSTYTSFIRNSCDETRVSMGQHAPKSTRGNFYLETSNNEPFAMG